MEDLNRTVGFQCHSLKVEHPIELPKTWKIVKFQKLAQNIL